MATKAYDIIKRPIITERSMAGAEMKRYTFEVAKDANKIQIAKAVNRNTAGMFSDKICHSRPAPYNDRNAGRKV